MSCRPLSWRSSAENIDDGLDEEREARREPVVGHFSVRDAPNRSITFPVHDNASPTSGVASNGSRSWRAIAPEASSPNSARVTAPPRCRYRPNAPRRGRPLCLFGSAQTGHDAKPRSSAFPTSCSRRECSRSGGLQSSGPSNIHFGTSARSSRLLMLNCMALWPNGGSRVSSAPRTYRGSRAWPFST